MSAPASRINTRLFLYAAVAALVALSAAFLWRNDQQQQDIQNLQHSLYNAQIEIRVLQAQKMFGAPFISPFAAVGQHGQPATLPDLGKGHMLFLFFKSWHSPMYLDFMSLFGPEIGDNVPVIGVLQAESAEEISPIVDKFRYSFPVYLAVDSPFDLPDLPYAVLVDGTGNVLRLSPIDYTDTNSAEAGISEISNFVSAAAPGDGGQPPSTAASGDEGQPEPSDRPDTTAQQDSADQPDSAAQPPPTGRPDPVVDAKAGIYTPTTVDTRAEAIYHPPIPSDNAALLNFEGVVVIQLVVGTTGNVDTANVERSSDRVSVDSLLVDVAQKMVWTPAVHEGERVKMRVSLPFMFRKSPATPGEGTETEE